MCLSGEEERMILQFDHLDDAAVRGKSGEGQTIVSQDPAEVIVDLVAMSVTLMDLFGTV